MAGYREVLDEECYLKRGSASMIEDKGKIRYHNHTGGSNRRIVDLKTGKTRHEEEYEKTVRLPNLMNNRK